MAAGEGDGAGDQASHRVQAEHAGQTHADNVLHKDKCAHDGGEHHQRNTAGFQAGEIRAQADGGKENQHKCVLQRFLKLEADARGRMQAKQADSRHQAACHRLGNVEIPQKLDFVNHQFTQ